MQPLFTTENLYFRKFEPGDADLVLQLNSDPGVTQFTQQHVYTIEAAEAILKNSILAHYETYGYGRWAVFLKKEHQFLGWCGIKYRPAAGLADLGYRFHSRFWGRGYAKEAASASVAYAFNVLNMEQLVAAAEPENGASVRILMHCGFERTGMGEVDGFPVILFRLSRQPGR